MTADDANGTQIAKGLGDTLGQIGRRNQHFSATRGHAHSMIGQPASIRYNFTIR
jgi:hypothetical protein